MERRHSIPIRERRAPEDDSVPIEFPPEPGAQPQVAPPQRPLVVSFRFGRRVILADPAWSLGADRSLLYIQFRCPHCWEPVTSGVRTMNEHTGAITAQGCVPCGSCRLHLHIEAGVATVMPTRSLCYRAPHFVRYTTSTGATW